MKHLFVPSEIAILAKKNGFNESCLGYYNEVAHNGKWAFDNRVWENATNYVPAPLYQQMIDFFIKKGIVISIYNNASGYLWDMAKAEGGTHIAGSEFSGPNESGCWDEYYEALTAAFVRSFDKLKDIKS